jgi:hypothetical protein
LFTHSGFIMKKLLVAAALVFGALGAAQAQVHFDSGSDRPNNPHAVRHYAPQHRSHAPMRPRERVVRCRDGSHRIARMCRGHGGVRR